MRTKQPRRGASCCCCCCFQIEKKNPIKPLQAARKAVRLSVAFVDSVDTGGAFAAMSRQGIGVATRWRSKEARGSCWWQRPRDRRRLLVRSPHHHHGLVVQLRSMLVSASHRYHQRFMDLLIKTMDAEMQGETKAGTRAVLFPPSFFRLMLRITGISWLSSRDELPIRSGLEGCNSNDTGKNTERNRRKTRTRQW